ncbi:hypothetical protein OAJ50_03945 [Candidatus Nitrosopelagicus sp.]|nr:hypothetical protein [Candidatus Nitrosopelagicus sp.]
MGVKVKKINRGDIIKPSSDAFTLFLEGIRSQESKYRYTLGLKRFLCVALADYLEGNPKKIEEQRKQRMEQVKTSRYHKEIMKKPLDADFQERCNEFISLCRQDPEEMINLVLTYQLELKEHIKLPKGHEDRLTAGYVKNLIKPIRKLCQMNGVAKDMAWERVIGARPEGEKEEYRAYTKDEIRNRILPYLDSDRDRAITFTALSSGIRKGGFVFTWDCIKPVYRKDGKLELGEYTDSDENVVCIIFDIYKGTDFHYIAFGTPEAWVHIKSYMEEWKNYVRIYPKSDQYFIKSNLYKERQALGEVIRASPSSYTQDLYRIFDDTGFNKTDGISKRREIPAMNGFRYFFNEHNKEAFSKDTLASLIKKEYMMSHTGLIKLDENYFRKNWKVLVEEYEYAIPHLTIDDNADLKVKLSKTEQELERLKNVEIKVEKMQHDMEAMEQVRETMDKE